MPLVWRDAETGECVLARDATYPLSFAQALMAFPEADPAYLVDFPFPMTPERIKRLLSVQHESVDGLIKYIWSGLA